MNEKQYLKLLEEHDWLYYYSDDHSVWKKGKQTADKINDLAESDPRLKAVYDSYTLCGNVEDISLEDKNA